MSGHLPYRDELALERYTPDLNGDYESPYERFIREENERRAAS